MNRKTLFLLIIPLLLVGCCSSVNVEGIEIGKELNCTQAKKEREWYKRIIWAHFEGDGSFFGTLVHYTPPEGELCQIQHAQVLVQIINRTEYKDLSNLLVHFTYNRCSKYLQLWSDWVFKNGADKYYVEENVAKYKKLNDLVKEKIRDKTYLNGY